MIGDTFVQDSSKDVAKVILLHGIVPTPGTFRKLEATLQQAGLKTLNLIYPSRKKRLEDLIEDVHASAADFIKQGETATHFVTHSMGGLVARAYIARYRPSNLGRVVMLGPPNQGSEIADLLANNILYRRFFGPAGRQLKTVTDDTLRQALGEVDYPLGIIAGDRAIDPFAWFIIQGPNDGRVSVARTAVSGMTDHLTMHVNHTLMTRNTAVINQVLHFISNGNFTPNR